MKQTASHKCHGGTLHYVEHEAESTQCTMRYSVFLPPKADTGKNAAVLFLSGLTCTEDNFTTKAHAYQKAAALGLIVFAPDTSPRGEAVPNDKSYDLGQGASFYLNATEAPWKTHFQMERYIAEEFLDHIQNHYPVDPNSIGIMGHSMGGHGALTLYLKYPKKFSSVSAFSPICAPTQCPWGEKAFTAYLGADRKEWQNHDATALMKASGKSGLEKRTPILIDQGTADTFLKEQLHPHLFQQACEAVGHPLKLRIQQGYDHSYFFISTFINDHLSHHAGQNE